MYYEDGADHVARAETGGRDSWTRRWGGRRNGRRTKGGTLVALQMLCAATIVVTYMWLIGAVGGGFSGRGQGPHLHHHGHHHGHHGHHHGAQANAWADDFSPINGWLRTALEAPGDGATLDPDPKHEVVAHRAAVSCDVPACSEMGTDILRRGGSAVDAAVTVALCIGSVNAHSSGLGGGGFMTVRHPNGSALTFDFRETAPAGASKHMYDGKPFASQFGGLAAGVPGELAGLDAAFQTYTSGELSWAELIEPVAAMNRKGFQIGTAMGRAIELASPVLVTNPGQWRWLFVPDEDSDGERLRFARAGDTLYRENYAQTLEIIAQNGSSAVFYDPDGPIAPYVAATIQRMGGIVTAQDIADYMVEVREPLRTTFMGREVLTSPNPTSGPALIMALNALQMLYEDDEEHHQRDLSPVATQRLVEVMKWMAAARTELGDPADVQNPRADDILTHEWARRVAEHVSDSHTLANWTEYDPSYEPNDPHGTAHFSVIDENGMAVSLTTTVNLYFGGMIADPVTGVIINSEMDDFSLPDRGNAYELRPSIYNFVAPGKRPLSSTAPTIISYDGEVELVIGAAGGSRIVTAVLQAIVRTYIYGESLLRTIARPRLHHQLLPEVAYFEFGAPDSVIEALEDRGHNVTLMAPVTAMNGILRDRDGKIYAVADYWRKGGRAAGY